jgi:hypothetical protein
MGLDEGTEGKGGEGVGEAELAAWFKVLYAHGDRVRRRPPGELVPATDEERELGLRVLRGLDFAGTGFEVEAWREEAGRVEQVVSLRALRAGLGRVLQHASGDAEKAVGTLAKAKGGRLVRQVECGSASVLVAGAYHGVCEAWFMRPRWVDGSHATVVLPRAGVLHGDDAYGESGCDECVLALRGPEELVALDAARAAERNQAVLGVIGSWAPAVPEPIDGSEELGSPWGFGKVGWHPEQGLGFKGSTRPKPTHSAEAVFRALRPEVRAGYRALDRDVVRLTQRAAELVRWEGPLKRYVGAVKGGLARVVRVFEVALALHQVEVAAKEAGGQ